jgi:putative membrane-bound dehydrogenase-like protein
VRLGVVLGVFVIPVIILADDTSPAPLAADKAAQQMVLPEGFHATVFAAEPDVVQPISFCIDARGRVWVAEALNYGQWKETGNDRITILEDSDGDGKADLRSVFYEGFNYITGLEVGLGGVWVISPPRLYFVPDFNNDDRPDGPPQVVLDGFGYKESRHNLVNGFTWGPDGWLYGGHGRTSPSDVGLPGTPANQRVHCDGGVYRIHPTKRIFENFADGTTNPWGVDFNDFGDCFVSNCVTPHLYHMIPGGHYEPWRNRPSSRYAYERLPTIADHLHYPEGDLRAVLGKPDTLAMGGGHAHCGTLIYLGDGFPAQYRNTALMCNVHGRRINNDIVKPKGSGYVASHGKDFMISADPWFMGVTLRTGPDGSIFVSDWSDTGECHTYHPHTTTGRIYKISYGKRQPQRVDLSKLTDDELVQLQLHKNDWYVQQARRILQHRALGRPTLANANLQRQLVVILRTHPDPTRRLRALWALQATELLPTELLRERLADKNEYVLAWIVRFLAERGVAVGELTRHSSPVVRLALASALQRLPAELRWSIAEPLVKHADDAQDANLPLMYWYGLEPLVPTDPTRAIQLATEARIPLIRRFIARRVTDDVLEQGPSRDLTHLVTVLCQVEQDVQRDLLTGTLEALRGRKTMSMPKGWPNIYAQLRESNDQTIRHQARAIALIFGDAQAVADLKAIARNSSATATERIASIEALIDHHPTDLASLLHELLDEKAVRQTAIRGLATVPHPATPEKLLSLYPRLTKQEQADVIATLSTRKEFARALLNAVEKAVVPRSDVSAFAARQIYSLNDAALTNRLRAVWGEIRETDTDKRQTIARYQQLLTPSYLRTANLENGKAIFANTCQQCHKLRGEGGSIGPDLTGSNRSNLEYLLNNLVDPSAEVSRDYRMSIIRTVDERVITGIVVERSPTRVVVQTATDRLTLSTEDVASVNDSTVSMMPAGLLDNLTKEHLRDLIAYLQSK